MGRERCSVIVRAALAGVFMVVSAAPLAQGRAAISVKFYIEEQPLIAALNDWSKQSGLQVVWPSRNHAQYGNTVLLQGTFAPMQALELLLRNSGLTYSMINDRTVVIREPPPQASSGVVTQKFWRAAAAPGVGGPMMRSGTRAPRQSQITSVEESIAEVVVTGTHIRGAAPAGSAVTTYRRERLDQSGAASVEQFARQMPGNFANVDSISGLGSNVSFAALSGGTNSFNASAFNLGGLGPGATLTLLNGHRMAAAGNDGAFVDISMIPLTAVDHIDVLADGASAIYGTDAVAGVVNIVMRKDFDGAESQLRYGGATDGGADSLRASQLLGTRWRSGNVLLNYEFNRKGRLDASQRDYIGDQGGPFTLMAKDRQHGLFLSGRQDIDAASTVSVDALVSKRDSTGPYSSASSIVTQRGTTHTESKQHGVAVSADRSFAGGWRATLTGNYSFVEQDNLSVLAVDFGGFGYDQRHSTAIESKERSLDLVVDGALFSWVAGAVKIAAGASYRKEDFGLASGLTQSTGFEFSDPMATLHRYARSVFSELSIPIIGARNSMPLARLVEISAAVRRDEYSDFGATTNPKFGLKWALSEALDVRGTYGESFRAPLLAQIGPPANYQTYLIPNPNSPDGFTNTLFIGGGNAALNPETADTFTIGLDFHPEELPALRLSATYFDIRFRDRVALPPITFDAQIFTSPLAAPFLNQSPSAADIEAAFNSPNFIGDNAGMGPAGVGAIFDQRVANLSTVKQSGVQVRAGYDLATSVGQFAFATQIERLMEYDLQVAPGADYIPLLNTFAEPTRWRGHGQFSWTQGGFMTALAINHVSAYDNSLTTPRQRIDAWTTGDLYFSYDANDARSAAWMRGMRIALSIQNVTNEEPPFTQIPAEFVLPGANPLPFDPTNASPLGRFIALQVSKHWGSF
jgi:outer membrane receptor protein involved in Fe transport